LPPSGCHAGQCEQSEHWPSAIIIIIIFYNNIKKPRKMRKQLSKKEIKELISEIEEKFGITELLSKKDNVVREDSFLKVNEKIIFFYNNEQLIPTLKLIISLGDKLSKTNIKKIIVDMGAIKFVINGADIMRPGITEIEEGINKDNFVVILDEQHKKPLAIGISLMNSEELKAANSGKVIKNIHFVGDDTWKSS
jgi:PUA-domain protein